MRYIAALLMVLLLVAAPRVAHATLGMCTVTGIVYNVDGSVAAGGTVDFRLPFTQTFSADSVQNSLEHVVLDSGGNIPAGTQVPLGARIGIQVGRDKPVSVVVTNNPANCPIAFGTLYGASAGGVPIPSTVITSISTINNIPGITDTAVNPPGAGPATLTLSDGYPITFGSSSSAADLSGTGLAPLFTQVGTNANGVFMQDETSATTASSILGHLVFGSTGTSDTEKRDAIIEAAANGAIGTHANGQMNFYLANGSGTALSTLGPVVQMSGVGATSSLLTATGNQNATSAITVSNTNAGASAQSAFNVANVNGVEGNYAVTGAGSSFSTPFLSNEVYVDSGTSNGLLLYPLAGPLHLAASGEGGLGTADLTEDASADFFLTIPALFDFAHNFNGALGVLASNTTSGTGAQAYFQAKSNPGTTFFGTRSVGWTAGDIPANYGFLETDAGTSGLYLVSDAGTGDEGIHFAANNQLAAGNLTLTEDAGANFFLTMPNELEFVHNANGFADVIVSNTNAGASAQASFSVANSNGEIAHLSATGASSSFGAPYTANMPYLNGLSNTGLLLYAAGGGALHLAASAQGGAGTLDMTEDGSGNVQFAPTNGTGFTRFFGGGTTQPALIAQSTQNAGNDDFEVLPQNNTQGIGFIWNEIHEIGTLGNNALGIDSQGSGVLNLESNCVGSGCFVQNFSSLGTVNNHHQYSALNGGTQPAISSCGGTATVAMRAGSTDVAGELDVTVGGSISPSCLINFGAAWGANPVCTCSSWNGVSLTNPCGTNTSTTQMNLWMQASFNAGGIVTWHCTGLVNGASG